MARERCPRLQRADSLYFYWWPIFTVVLLPPFLHLGCMLALSMQPKKNNNVFARANVYIVFVAGVSVSIGYCRRGTRTYQWTHSRLVGVRLVLMVHCSIFVVDGCFAGTRV